MLFYVPKYETKDGSTVEVSREYFDHSTICGIDKHPNGCVIDLANGRKVECPRDPLGVALRIQSRLASEAQTPGITTEPESLEI